MSLHIHHQLYSIFPSGFFSFLLLLLLLSHAPDERLRDELKWRQVRGVFVYIFFPPSGCGWQDGEQIWKLTAVSHQRNYPSFQFTGSRSDLQDSRLRRMKESIEIPGGSRARRLIKLSVTHQR